MMVPSAVGLLMGAGSHVVPPMREMTMSGEARGEAGLMMLNWIT
jgi:hypothetical protein